MSTIHKPNGKFKAVFNPFDRHLAVLYGSSIYCFYFDAIEEWHEVSLNNDAEQPQYLHIQLDYEEYLQLLFYPRVDGDPNESLNEDLGTFCHFDFVQPIPENVKLAFTEKEFNQCVKDLGNFPIFKA